MEQSPGSQDMSRAVGDGARRPQVIAAEDGTWVEKPPPDLQPQFRCIRRARGTILPVP